MPPAQTRGNDRLRQAKHLAHELAPDIDTILLTHFTDADTLDTLRPGETDLATTIAINREVAAIMAEAGVEVLVQKADRAAFRRWISTQPAEAANPYRWIDRSGLFSGADAFRLLGLPAPAAAEPEKFPTAPGPTADRLIAAYNDDDGDAFAELTNALLAAGRTDVLDLAIRKTATHHGQDTADALAAELLGIAEAGPFGPAGWAELMTLPVALPAKNPPDAAALGDSLCAAGILPDAIELRFLPGWRSPDALDNLSPAALRRVLLDLVAGREPRDIPPGDTDDLAKSGFGLLLGLQIDWDLPIWDDIVANGLPDAPDEDGDTPEEARADALFDAWRAATFEANQGCVPLALTPASAASAEIADFLAEAASHTDAIEDIRDFIAMTRREAGGDDIVCRPEIIGDALELSIYTNAGRFLDSLTLGPKRLPAPAEEIVALVGTFVRVVRDVPGR